jgi:hypothetical protein
MKTLSIEKMGGIEGGLVDVDIWNISCGINFLIAAEGADDTVRTILYSLFVDYCFINS